MSSAARSRMLGRLLMVVAVLQMLAFFAGLSRRSYLVVALPVGGGLAALSALAFWVGYTQGPAEPALRAEQSREIRGHRGRGPR